MVQIMWLSEVLKQGSSATKIGVDIAEIWVLLNYQFHKKKKR